MIISLYAGGMTIRDIGYHVEATVGTELLHDTISKITDEVLDGMVTRQTRPLGPLCPVVYLDAIVVRVRDGHHVKNKIVLTAIGVTIEGTKQDLGSGLPKLKAPNSGPKSELSWPVVVSRMR